MQANSPVFVRRLLFLAAPVAFGLLALSMGMDADWDLRNYHYYNAWAFLTGRHDVAVAQIPTFYNPLLDVPYFLLAQVLSARSLAFLLGALHGLNFILLTLLGERLLAAEAPWKRLASAALLAAVGSCGAVALSEVGTVFYDNLLSLGLFGSLLLAVANWSTLASGRSPTALGLALVAGLPAGLAFGLKQTAVIFPVGVCAALLFTLPSRFERRFLAAFCFGIGVLLAGAAGGGYWMAHLWHTYGNPVFPYFNQVFHSPWGLPDPYRDTQYLNGPFFWKRLLFPLVFSFDTRQASEIVFRDFRILAAFMLLPVAGVAGLVRKFGRQPAPHPFVRTDVGTFVLVAAAIVYGVWLQMFANYRYITALEMLAPLLVVLACNGLPGAVRPRLTLATTVVAILALTTRPGEWIRVAFTDEAIEVQRPAVADPADTMVLLAGHEPLSFLLPAFPPEMRFLRIDSTFTNPDQTTVRFNEVMRRLVSEHKGPLLALFIPTERHDVIKRLGNYGLSLAPQPCVAVTSPIGAAPYALCPVVKQ